MAGGPTPVMKLKTIRCSAAGIPVGLRGTGNPGGPGQHWVKALYIDPAPRGYPSNISSMSKRLETALCLRDAALNKLRPEGSFEDTNIGPYLTWAGKDLKMGVRTPCPSSNDLRRMAI